MYLLELAKKSLSSPAAKADLQSATRFTVNSCPWLKGRIIYWSPGGVTVKYDIPNTPFDNDHLKPEKDAPEASVGNYSNLMCVSGMTEVTPA